jgi:hypothetical protein
MVHKNTTGARLGKRQPVLMSARVASGRRSNSHHEDLESGIEQGIYAGPRPAAASVSFAIAARSLTAR